MQNPVRSPKFLLMLWNRLAKLPGGRFVFRKALARAVPYSDTVNPEVLELRPGYARIRIKDQYTIHNHLGSIHAIALANLAELTSGLALNCALPPNARGILKSFSIRYLKKGRGTLIATSETSVPSTNHKQEILVSIETRNEAGETITLAEALWLIGPKPMS